MQSIQIVIFDLSEVLLTGIRDTEWALAEKHQLEALVDHNLSSDYRPQPLLVPLVREFFHGSVTEDQYIAEVVATYPQLGTLEELKAHIRQNFVEVAGTREIVIELKRLGYALGLLSVHAKEWIDYCQEKFDYHDLFDVRSYSYEVGVSKPDTLAFTSIVGQLKAQPEQCLFIDDSPVNVDAAVKLGMAGVVFTSAADLNARLKELLPNYPGLA